MLSDVRLTVKKLIVKLSLHALSFVCVGYSEISDYACSPSLKIRIGRVGN